MAADAILDFQKFKFLKAVCLRDQICIILQNLSKIGQSVAEIWQFFDFSRWRPSAVLDCAILKVWYSPECPYTSLCQIWLKSVKQSQRYRDLTVFQNVGCCHVGFSKFQTLNGRCSCETKSASSS